MEQPRLYIGTYAGEGAEGIYYADVDIKTGRITLEGVAEDPDSPSFIAFHPSGRRLYSVNLVGPDRAGFATAYAVEPHSGALTRVGRRPTGGTNPCYISVDAAGTSALVAHYGSGETALLSIQEDGALGDVVSMQKQAGSGPHPRQDGPHVHCALIDPSGRHALAADLGTDRIYVWNFNSRARKLIPAGFKWHDLQPGSGPRHMAFHPSGRFVYIINELNSTVTACAYDEDSGALKTLHALSTLPGDYQGVNYAADIHVHPSGRFVFGSNREHDSICIFGVDPHTGRLDPIGHASSQGRWPRSFAIHPSGRLLVVGNHKSGNVVSFWIDPDEGSLTPTGYRIDLPSAVCLCFAPTRA